MLYLFLNSNTGILIYFFIINFEHVFVSWAQNKIYQTS